MSDTASGDELPLSLPQFVMWFQHQQAPATGVCTVGFALRASGPLDVGAVRRSVQALVDRHAVLRTTYHVRDDTLVQRIAAAATVPFDVERCTAADAGGAGLRARIEMRIARSFDLERGPVFRATLFSDGADEHTLLVTFHHIAADGWSSQIMISELQSLYAAAATNGVPALPRPTVSYGDFVRWQAGELAGDRGERHWAYWQRVLAAPRGRTVLPTDVVRPAVPRFLGAAVQWELPAALVQDVQALAARLRTTPFVVLFGAFQLLLARLCGVRDVITGMPVLGRPTAEFMAVVGNFINVLPVRSWLGDTTSVTEFLLNLRATVLGALQRQHYPLSRIVQRLNLSGEETGQALFNTSFSLLAPDDREVVTRRLVAGTTFSLEPLALQTGMLDLGMDIVVIGNGMHASLKYSLDVLTGARAAGIARQYEAMIEAVTGAPERPLGDLLGAAGASSAATSEDARAATLLSALAARDITLALDGERLRVSAPKGALDAAARQAIAAQRPAIIARLRAATEDTAPDFWQRQLAGAPRVLALPTDRSGAARPGGPRAPLALLAHDVPGTLLERVHRIGETHGAGAFVMLMAAWQVLLHRYCGQDDIVVATGTGTARILPIRGRLSGNPSFIEFVDQIQRTVLAALEQPAPPASEWQVHFDRRAGGATPLAGVGSALETGDAGDTSEAVRTSGTGETSRKVDAVAAELALEITMPTGSGESGAARFHYRFRGDRFDVDTLERLHENFCTLLESIATAPTAHVLDLDLLGPRERRRGLRDSGADVEVLHDRSRLVHELLEASARSHPERVAVTGPGGELRYAALDARANQLAHRLLAMGLGRGELVAVCLERTVDLPVALAAVLKAGGAYVPLDPGHPRERLRGILRDSRAAVLLTRTGFEDIAEDTGAAVIRLDTDAAAIDACAPTRPAVVVDAGDLAYVIYTSGSTGRPKGVEVEHRNVVAFLEAMRRQPGCHTGDVLLAVTTVAFDIAGLELWLPLSVGARIVLATRVDALDGARLGHLLEAEGVSLMQATPATWRLMLESGWTGRPALRALCGGEALPQSLAAQLIGRVGELWNLYGPTETTIWSTAARLTAHDIGDGSGLIPIGRPIANTVVRIEDAAGRVVPAGVTGELLIGGEGVARGYRDQPERTANAFVTRDGGATPRWYRSGDLARFRGDGRLEFLGRRDHQIKLRGHRVEPGEIESLLAAWPGVMSSVVIARSAAAGDERLVAYVTLAAGERLDTDALRAALRARLPDYMVPGHVVVLPALPLTPNGKVDRNALPAPEVAADADTAPAPVPAVPMTPVQERVAVLWKEVLGVGRVGLNDNFFDIGGHSLLLVRMHAGLKREFGRELPLVELFQHTTVAQQARALERVGHG